QALSVVKERGKERSRTVQGRVSCISAGTGVCGGDDGPGWNGSYPAQHRNPGAVRVRHVEQGRIGILVHLSDLPVWKPTWIPGGEIVSDLARQERVRDIPDSDSLLNPRHVQQAGRPGIKPRMVNVVSVRGAAEAPAGGVEVVGDMRDA